MLGIINLRREILGSRIGNVDKFEVHHAFIVLFVHLEGIKVFSRIIHPSNVIRLVALVGIEQVAVDAHRINGFVEVHPELVGAFVLVVVLVGGNGSRNPYRAVGVRPALGNMLMLAFVRWDEEDGGARPLSVGIMKRMVAPVSVE